MLLSAEQIDALALESLNVVRSARRSGSFAYDVTGYRRVPRLDTPRGSFRVWDPPVEALPPDNPSAPPYIFRIAGFEPVSIGAGENFRRYFELMPRGLRHPITRQQQVQFEEHWDGQMRSIRDTCAAIGKAGGIDLVHDPEQMWVVMVGPELQPLDILLDRLEDSFEEVNEDFRAIYGHDLPLTGSPTTPREFAARAHLWEYMRLRYSQIALILTTVCRRYLKGLMVSNIEFDTQVDYAVWGEAFDMPGFNLRTVLCEDEVGRRNWVSYGTRLAADLTHRAPMISVRSNLVAAGARFVPSADAVRYWYRQAMHNGAAGFFLWMRDYPADQRDPEAYGGPCVANPDPSTRGPERWETHMEIACRLSAMPAFMPPPAEIGILVSMPSCGAGKWSSVFDTYVELARDRKLVRFISSRELRTSAAPLKGIRTLIVPHAPFEYRATVDRLLQASRDGLKIVIPDAGSFQYDENGEPLLSSFAS